MLPKSIAKYVPQERLMSEREWRSLGVQQSPGWLHYMIHKPGNLTIFGGLKGKQLLRQESVVINAIIPALQ